MSDRTVGTAIKNIEHLAVLDDIIKDRFAAMPLDKLMIYLVDIVSAEALPHLAAQFDVLGFKGYGIAENEAERRAVIKKAIELHRYKGTIYGLREAMASIGFDQTEIIERPAGYEAQYGAGHPFTFQIRLNESDYDGIDEAAFQVLSKIVDEYKNVRSHLVDVRIFIILEDQFPEFVDEINSILLSMEMEDVMDLGTESIKHNGQYIRDGSQDRSVFERDPLDIVCVPDPSVYDADAEAYLNLTGLDFGPCKNHIVHRLAMDLKSINAWDRLNYIYLFLSDGVANTRAFQASIDFKRHAVGYANGQITFSGDEIITDTTVKYDFSGTNYGTKFAQFKSIEEDTYLCIARQNAIGTNADSYAFLTGGYPEPTSGNNKQYQMMHKRNSGGSYQFEVTHPDIASVMRYMDQAYGGAFNEALTLYYTDRLRMWSLKAGEDANVSILATDGIFNSFDMMFTGTGELSYLVGGNNLSAGSALSIRTIMEEFNKAIAI